MSQVDSKALDGLKGFASMYVMAFHLFQKRSVDLCGSVMMPVFFLLSGFCLVLSSGKTIWDGCTVLFAKREGKLMDSRIFYLKRFARIVPLYYLVNLGCYLTLSMKGLGTIINTPSIIFTLTMTNSWTMTSLLDQSTVAPFPFDQQAWFVTTLIPFYAVFPLLLPQLQALSTSKLSSLLVILFHIQCLPFYIHLPSLAFPTLDNMLYWTASCHPLSRFPVFVMGMVAGVLRLRGIRQPSLSPYFYNCLHDILPWHVATPGEAEDISPSPYSGIWSVSLSFVLIVLYILNWFWITFNMDAIHQFLSVYALLLSVIFLNSDLCKFSTIIPGYSSCLEESSSQEE